MMKFNYGSIYLILHELLVRCKPLPLWHEEGGGLLFGSL